MRATRFAVLCSLIVFAPLVVSAHPSSAARARFRFGAQGSAMHLAPFTRNALAPGDTAWTGCGKKLAPDGAQAFTSLPLAFPTGSGGTLVAWSDQRSGRGACRASRLDFLGKYPAGWIAGGNLVSLSDSSQQLTSSGTDDAAGGFFVYTNVDPQFHIQQDLYLQHLTSSGAVAAGYPAAGKLMVPGYIGVAGMLPDGSGGLFLGLSAQAFANIQITRLDASGTATAGWPADGVDTGLSDTTSVEAAIDGAGGIYLVWSMGNELKIQRYASTGVVSGWPVGGLTVATSFAQMGDRFVRLSNNDALVCWVDPNFRIRAMRVNAAGSLDVGWPAGGKEISTAIGQEDPVLLQDAAGGALILWLQHTGGPPQFLSQPYVQHLTSAGAVATGWPADGVPLSSSATVSGYIQSLVSDGAGGAIAAWTDLRVGVNEGDVYAQRVLATGAVDPSWTADGVAICSAAGEQELAAITTDGSGGAILTLWDYGDSNNPQIRAARLLVNGIVSVLASLVDAAAEPGRVRLHWYTADGSVTLATVERADAGGAFVPVGEITADGVGHLRFEDRDVKAGATYQYRLAVRDGATTAYLGQVTIHVPAAVSFGIDGFRPNPAQGQVSVVFALESAAPARLELRDVAGRRVMTREVGMLGAGQHVLPLGQAAALPAGIYVLRLTQSGHQAVARAALVR